MIGGSIGLKAKKNNIAGKIVGISRREISAKKARRLRVVDISTTNIKIGLQDADLVIIAAPIAKIPIILKKIKKYCKKNSIIIDVGSVKKNIVSYAEKTLKKELKFVGTHPMAGSEKSGAEHADANLFANAVCIITKTKKTDGKAIKKVKLFWKRLGARCIELTPEAHDGYISLASHLPHVAAYALCLMLTNKRQALRLISGGFKDTTRIASSDPGLWSDILIDNREHVTSAIERYIGILRQFKTFVKKKDVKKLRNFISKAKNIKDLS